MFDCVPKRPLLPVKKKETNYLIRFTLFYIILYNFVNCPVLIDVKQTLRFKIALEMST